MIYGAMTNPDDVAFERMMRKVFPKSERDPFSLSAYMTEPLEPPIRDLIKIFTEMLIVKASGNVKNEDFVDEMAKDVRSLIEPCLRMENGGEILIKNPASYMAADDELWMLSEEYRIIGLFNGITVGAWCETPAYDYEFKGDPTDFERELGLIILIGNAAVISSAREERVGDILVPLEHGEPKWEQVVRPFPPII